jgi:hypothetical protein
VCLVAAANKRTPRISLNSEILRRLYDSVEIEDTDLRDIKGRSPMEVIGLSQVQLAKKMQEFYKKLEAAKKAKGTK